MARTRRLRRTYTPNQIVALNVARARALRGWTQEQASAALAPYLGTRWSSASFSAVERSIAGLRVKQFDADELVAFSRGFGLPIGWFFVPPPPAEDAGLATPDATMRGVDMGVLVDAVLGTADAFPFWRDALLAYAAENAASDAGSDGDEAVAGATGQLPTLDAIARLRAAATLRDVFGDVDEARDVLRRLTSALDELEAGEQSDTTSNKPARPSTSKQQKRKRSG